MQGWWRGRLLTFLHFFRHQNKVNFFHQRKNQQNMTNFITANAIKYKNNLQGKMNCAQPPGSPSTNLERVVSS